MKTEQPPSSAPIDLETATDNVIKDFALSLAEHFHLDEYHAFLHAFDLRVMAEGQAYFEQIVEEPKDAEIDVEEAEGGGPLPHLKGLA